MRRRKRSRYQGAFFCVASCYRLNVNDGLVYHHRTSETSATATSASEAATSITA